MKNQTKTTAFTTEFFFQNQIPFSVIKYFVSSKLEPKERSTFYEILYLNDKNEIKSKFIPNEYLRDFKKFDIKRMNLVHDDENGTVWEFMNFKQFALKNESKKNKEKRLKKQELER